jgi:hypothetical protein
MGAKKKICFGTPLVYGVCDLKPIIGAPIGRKKIRMRPKVPALLFVSNGMGVRRFLLINAGDKWFRGPETGRNHRPVRWD